MPYLITLREFDRATDAYYYKSALKNYEIESYVEMVDYEEDTPLDATELGKATLSVLQGDIEDSIEVLRQIDMDYFGEEYQNLEKFNEDELVIVKKMSLKQEAYLYKARLINEGLTCFIVDKHGTNPLPLVGLTASTIELYVPKSQLFTAGDIILEMDNKNMVADAENPDKKPLLIGVIVVLIVLFLLVEQYFSMY